MRAHERVGWSGRLRATVRDVDGRVLHVLERPNVITDGALDLIRDALTSATPVTELLYLALGDDNTAPAASDTTLGNEFFRKRVTSFTSPSTGEVISTTFVAASEANQQIEEVGWFAGDASAAADSGVLVARLLYSRLKDNEESIQFDRTDTFARG